MTLDDYLMIAAAAVALVQSAAVFVHTVAPGSRADTWLGALARALPADFRPLAAKYLGEGK